MAGTCALMWSATCNTMMFPAPRVLTWSPLCRLMFLRVPERMSQTRCLSGVCQKSEIDTIIRVDHAGEFGADRIYAGQMAVLGHTKSGPVIKHMWEQEKVHKLKFEELIRKHRVRPTVMLPIWNIAGFALGAGSALLGEKAAMACTTAVETVITEHYNNQLRSLMEDPETNKELLETITKFRDEEQEHHDTGIDHGAEKMPFYNVFSEAIKLGCKVAIEISKKI